MLFPAQIYKRKNDGSFQKIDVMLRIPRENELRAARAEARAIATSDGLDLDRDKDLIDNIENICIMVKAIRNCTSPYESWEPDPRILEKKYDRASLMQVWAKLEALTAVVNPAPDRISAEEIWAVVCRIAEEGNLLPLHVYGSEAQSICVITMAKQLVSLAGSKSSSEPSEPSTAD